MNSTAAISINHAYNGDNENDNALNESEYEPQEQSNEIIQSCSELSSERVQRTRNEKSKDAIRKTEETLKRVAEITSHAPTTRKRISTPKKITNHAAATIKIATDTTTEQELEPNCYNNMQEEEYNNNNNNNNKNNNYNNNKISNPITEHESKRTLPAPPALHPAKLKTVTTSNTISQYLIRLTKNKTDKPNKRSDAKLSISARGRLLAQDRALGRKRPTFEDGVDFDDLPQDISIEELKARIHNELEEYRKMGPLMPVRLTIPPSRSHQGLSKRPLIAATTTTTTTNNNNNNNSNNRNNKIHFRETHAFADDTISKTETLQQTHNAASNNSETQ